MAQAYAGSFASSIKEARGKSFEIREALIQELDELREEIISRFSSQVPSLPSEKVQKDDRRGLERELDAALSTFGRLIDNQLDAGVRQLSVRGGRITTDALLAAGVPVTEPFTEGIADVFKSVAKSVTKLVESVKKRIMSGVDAAVAGALNAVSFLEFIRSILNTNQHERRGQLRRTGPAYLLEQMAETTMLQGFSVSQQEAAERLARQVPDLRKTWVSAGDGRERRGHAEAQAKYAPGGDVGPIPVNEKYEILDYSNTGMTEWATVKRAPRRVLRVPQYRRTGSVQSGELMHPRDPEAGISFIVSCRCVSMEVVGSFDAALDQAAGIVREEL